MPKSTKPKRKQTKSRGLTSSKPSGGGTNRQKARGQRGGGNRQRSSSKASSGRSRRGAQGAGNRRENAGGVNEFGESNFCREP